MIHGAVVLATLAGAGAALAIATAGCVGDDSIGPPDAKPDMSSDHTMMHDAHGDAKHRDARPPPDVKPLDAPPDAPPDVMFFDVGDAGFDVIVPDAPFEVSLAQFPSEVNKAYCERTASCCAIVLDGGVDAGGFLATCMARYTGYSAAGNLNLANLSSPNINYDPAKAELCLEQLAATPCGTVMAAQSELSYLTCASAIVGKLGVGKGPCGSSFDCTPGAYCPSDGGTCTALATLGGSCTDTTYSTDCTYLGNGEPLLYCDPDSGTCSRDLPVGSSCFEYQQCTSQVCTFGISTGTCTTSSVFADPTYCAAF